MSEIFQIAPWYSTEEWNEVYNNIYEVSSTLRCKQNALDQLLIWKARCPSLPSGIESTMSILYVHVQDVGQFYEVSNDHLLRLAYSSALMRFVNHMLDNQTAKGLSLYRAARSLGVPEWIIELRHDTAHSNRLPNLELLREASIISLQWLKKNYWDTHKLCINDYVVGKVSNETEIEKRVTALINFCVSLSISSHPGCNIKNLAQITDSNLRECLVNDAKELLEDSLDLSNLKTVSISTLKQSCNRQAKKILNTDSALSYVNKVLLSDESAFLSLELYKHVDFYSYSSNRSFSRDYVQCFDGLLSFLFTNDLMADFLLDLIKVTQNESINGKKCKLAARWVAIILNALNNNQQFMDMIKRSNIDIKSKDMKELKSLYYHWFPNEKKNKLLLDLQKPVPKEFTNINFIQPIISTYNSFLFTFIRDLLNLVRPKLHDSVVAKICKLSKVIALPEEFPVATTKIYTADDIKLANDLENSLESKYVEIINVEVEMEGKDTGGIKRKLVEKEKTKQKFGIWQQAPKNPTWSTCPIGQLPWAQLSVDIPMET